MQLILNSNTFKLREIAPDHVKVTVSDSFVDLETYKINDMGTLNTIIINQDGEVPAGMTADDVSCHKRYNWYFNIAAERFMKVI